MERDVGADLVREAIGAERTGTLERFLEGLATSELRSLANALAEKRSATVFEQIVAWGASRALKERRA